MGKFMNVKTIAALSCLSLVGLSANGCTKTNSDSDTDTGLPPDTDTDQETGNPFTPGETGAPADVDQIPDHWLYLYQDGSWTLSPHGGPYTAFVGQMVALELLDVNRPDKSDTDTDADTGYGFDTGEASPIACRTVYNLIGYPTEDVGCPSCSFTFYVEFHVVEGDPSLCQDPELPQDKEVRTLGFDEASSTIQYDYFGSGFWLPWYSGSLKGNTLTFDWSAKVGISMEMEE
jgi:hypothetical protein